MTIQLIDDSQSSRDGFQELFADIDMKANSLEKINSNLTTQLSLFTKDDFIISDFKLKNHSCNYSPYDGDIIIAEAYKNKIPGILCSSVVTTNLELSRTIRRYIPEIIQTQKLFKELDSNYIKKIKDTICDEFNEKFTKKRRPWRALLRTTDYDSEHKTVYVEIPSWKPDTKLSIPFNDFPNTLKDNVIKDGFRFHALVNLDCENEQELYIYEIEER